MEINGKPKVYGLIGNPVGHTMSPRIHNMLAELQGVDMVYVPFAVKENLLDAVTGAYALGVEGLNVTIPYKQEVMQYCTKVDEMAASIGAVNTLIRTPEGYEGYNTDMSGLYRAFCLHKIELRGKKIILLGAGGAARAVAMMCVRYGASELYLVNRTKERADAIAEEIRQSATKCKVNTLLLSEYESIPEDRYIAIQCTSVGLYPNVDEAVIEDNSFYSKIEKGYDLVYRPQETKFMKLVGQAGGEAFNGLSMLLFQGIIAYELWNHINVSDKMAMRVYEQLKGEQK